MNDKYKIFLSYVNKSFDEDLSQLLNFLDEISGLSFPMHFTGLDANNLHTESSLPLPEIKLINILRTIASCIVSFNQKGLSSAYNEKELIRKKYGYPEEIMEIAFESLYGYRDNYCVEVQENVPGCYGCTCSLYYPGINTVDDFYMFEKYYLSQNRINCITCHQLFIKRVIENIINGTEYTAIPGFTEFVQTVPKFLIDEVAVRKQEIKIDQKWKNPFYGYRYGYQKGPDPEFPYKNIFNDYIRAIVGYSLGSYIAENGRDKIRKCLRCNKIFIPLNKTGKFCSPPCKNNFNSHLRVLSGEAAKFKREGRKNGKYQ
jgi:hypothetical protein